MVLLWGTVENQRTSSHENITTMKTCIPIATLLLLFGTYASADELRKQFPFKCPFECKSSRYEPICARGKSYASACILKLQICSGYEDIDMWKDVEACPKYDKDEDTRGSSVEAIDKNGVVFRHFFDNVKVRSFTPRLQKKPTLDLIIEKKTKIHDYRVDKFRGRSMCTGNLPCIDHDLEERPVCIQGVQVSSLCLVKHLVCDTHLPPLAILLAKPCETSSSSNLAIVSVPGA